MLADLGSESLLPGSVTAVFSSHGRKARDPSGVLYKGTGPIDEGPFLMT